jgi:molybdenum cofactor cytidylyltransferase
LAEILGTQSVLSHTVRNAIASGLPVVVVTTPAFSEEAARLVARRDVVVLGQRHGGKAPGGMGDSIAAGVAARPSAGGWLLLPADMPLVKPQTMVQVASALGQHAAAYAQYKGRRGHPVAFGAELLSDLLRQSGDEGARRILARYPAVAVDVSDPGVLLDMDTEEDLAALRERMAQEADLGLE